MKFIRNLLSHGILLIFIIALCGAYYYRAVIFSEDVNARVNSAVNILLVTFKLEPMQTKVVSDVAIVPVCESPQEAIVEEAIVEEAIVEEAIVEEAVVEEAVVEEAIVEEAIVEEAIVEEAIVEEAIVEEAVVNEESTDAKTIMENIPVDKHFELLNQARFAHQIGNNFNAIELYLELINTYPEDPNVYGELGNVYYSKGKWKQASHAYYEAAIRLHKIEKTEQINYLVRVIEGLDPETAQKLNDQLGHK